MNFPDSMKVMVTLTNTGKRDGEEIVQLYTRCWYADVTRPLKELKGFQKVFLKAGESRQITFMLRGNDLKFYDQQMNRANEEGKYSVFVGGSSADCVEQNFQLVK
jgi:beta-glucosidase